MNNTFASVSLANSLEIVRVFIPLQSVDEDCRWSSWKTVIGDSLNLFADSDLREILEEHQITEWTVAEGTAPECFVRAIYQLSLIHGDGPWNVLPYQGITLTQWATIKQDEILSLFFSEWAQVGYPGILISPTFQVWMNRYGNSVVLSGGSGLFHNAQRIGLEVCAALPWMALPFDLQEHHRISE